MGSVLVDVIKNQYQCQSCHDPSDQYGGTKLIKARKSTLQLCIFYSAIFEQSLLINEVTSL